jgi:hypothetical protein
MSNTKREPLLSDRDLWDKSPEKVRDIYEAARAKDAELIQRLIHEGNAMAALIEVNEPFIENDVRRSHWHSHRVSWMAANDAAAAEYKPSKP